MKLALHKAFRQVGATDHAPTHAAEAIAGALEKRMTDQQTPYAKLTDLQAVKVDMADLKSQFSVWRGEMKQDIAAVRGEVAVLRAEMKQEISIVRAELKQEITAVRAEMRQEIAAVRGDVSQLRGEVKHELASTRTELIRWMVAGQLTTVTVLGSLIFGVMRYLMR
jgi:hypothetical protein